MVRPARTMAPKSAARLHRIVADDSWTVLRIETPFTLPGLIGPNWTSKTEYLYVDLGTQTGAFTIPGLAAATSSTQIHEHILRSSLSYHFNSPVIAKY